MIVGEVVNGMRAMTPRTKAKLAENTKLLLDALALPNADAEQLIYNALSWTADDVLAQAIAGENQPPMEGVL